MKKGKRVTLIIIGITVIIFFGVMQSPVLREWVISTISNLLNTPKEEMNNNISQSTNKQIPNKQYAAAPITEQKDEVDPSELYNVSNESINVAIHDPKLIPAEEANSWMRPYDRVLYVIYNGEKRAYPIKILNWHHLVDDYIGDTPVIITYSPLSGSPVVFIREVKNRTVDFGISDYLWRSSLLMEDNDYKSLWSQVLGKAIQGNYTGETLQQIQCYTATWESWMQYYPESKVLSIDTGFNFDYNVNPYEDYQNSNYVDYGVTFNDTRLSPKAIVYSVNINGKQKSYSLDLIKDRKVINDNVSNVPILVIWDYTMDTAKIFERTVGNETLTFGYGRGRLIDNNGNLWNFKGNGISDDNFDERLTPVSFMQIFWFAQLTFYPETELYTISK